MADLKTQLIRLGTEHKALRSHIRPVLAELNKVAASSFQGVCYDHFEDLMGMVEMAISQRLMAVDKEGRYEMKWAKTAPAGNLGHIRILHGNGFTDYAVSMGANRSAKGFVTVYLRKGKDGINSWDGALDNRKIALSLSEWIVRDLQGRV